MTKKGKPEVKRDGGAHPQQLLSGSLDAKLDNRQKVCSHYTYEGKVHLKQMLLSIVAYTHCLPCQICPKDSIVKNEDLENLKNGGGQQLHKKKNKTKKGSGTRKVQANVAKIDIWVCLTCAGHFCAAAGDIRADSHARGHAMQTEHWWAVKYVDPTTVYCFKCALVVPVNMGIIADEEAETATPDAYFVIQGLSSLGTVSCFNALLQNLLALTPLREEMLRLDFPRKAHICVALKKLIKRTRRTTQGGISPEQEYLLSKIYSMFPHFRISHMLDSEASLRSFLHALHTEEKEAWAGIPEDVNSTIVESIFEGQCSITISCNECSHCLVDYEEFCYLSLTAPLSSDSTEAADGADDKVDEINGPISLENCLKLYTDPEPWFCEKCAKAEGPKIDEEGQANKNQQKDDDMKVSVGATRRVLISAPPTVLALHLKRFSQSKRLEEGHVHYKEDLHIGPFVDPRSGVDDHVTYRLVGVLLHKETTTGGHYIANVRADRLIQRGSIVFWYNAIDGQVKKTSFESFEGEPHLLFYQKVMPENVSEEDMSVVKKANKNKQLEVTGKEIHGKGSVPDMIESHDEKVMPENVSEEDMGVVKKANKNKQWEVTGKEVHGKGSVPDMIESHDEQCLTNASQSSPNLTQEGTQLADIRMGEKSQLADINMQLQTGASVSDLSRPPLDEVLPWDYQRTRNPSRKARNKIAQDDDIVGQKIGFFLDRYILNGDRKPYYHFELVTMCERGSGSQQLNIHYSHLLEFSKDVAMDVCNGYTRLVPVLKETAIRFAQELLTDPDLNLTVTARERMQQLASAKSASSLELNFLEMPKVHKRLRNCLQPPLTRRMQVYGSMPKVIRIPLPEKCALVQRLLAHVISGHRAGFSWDGDFSIDDVEAYDDRVLIAKEPKPFPIHPTISLEMIRAMEKDFARIASVVKKFKCSDSRVSIPYLKAFLTMLSGMREYAGWWSDSAAAEALRELIEHHPFLKL